MIKMKPKSLVRLNSTKLTELFNQVEVNSSLIYYVKFWRNDGDWHDIGYDLTPRYLFTTSNDELANSVLLVYMILDRRGTEDFNVEELHELTIQELKPYDFFRVNKRPVKLIKQLTSNFSIDSLFACGYKNLLDAQRAFKTNYGEKEIKRVLDRFKFTEVDKEQDNNEGLLAIIKAHFLPKKKTR